MNLTHSLLRSPLHRTRNLMLASVAMAMAVAAPAQAAGVPKAYRFTSTANNTSTCFLTLDHPAFNGKPTLKLLISQYFNGAYNPHPVGVAYSYAVNKWQIINEDKANIPLNSGFNVMVAPAAKLVSISPQNCNGLYAFFPTGKNNANAVLQVTHVLNAVKNLDGVLQPNAFSLFYYGATAVPRPYTNNWTLYYANGDSHIATNYNIADFSKVKVGGELVSFRHQARNANTTDLETTITNPLTDAKPNVAVFIQHVFTQAAAANVDEVMGVRYADGKWRILTEDQTDKLSPVDFNVTVLPLSE